MILHPTLQRLSPKNKDILLHKHNIIVISRIMLILYLNYII